MPTSNATSRFSDRVENYVRYRPRYPAEALRVLKDECGLAASDVIVDIASGTGIWTRMLLENGNPVFGVEPNAEMRQAGERLLAGFPRFTSVAGTAEATTLPDALADFVTVAQAGTGLIASGRDRSLCESLGPKDGSYSCGMNGSPTRLRSCAITSNCC
jgi:SAM-dependent methyltransferase